MSRKLAPRGSGTNGASDLVVAGRPDASVSDAVRESKFYQERIWRRKHAVNDAYSDGTLQALRKFCFCGKVASRFYHGEYFCSEHKKVRR
jgi:hypothetical protein